MGATSIETTGQDGETVRVVKEGKATILVPKGAEIKEDKNEVQQVFYNPIQQYNRDLSVLAIRTYGEKSLEIKRQAFLKAKKGRQNRKRKREGDAEAAATQTAGDKVEGAGDAAPATEEKTNGEGEHGEKALEEPAPSFKILDALSASGLRALRYGHEIPFVTSITANDLSPTAAESIRQNVKHNGLEKVIHVTEGDALGVMYRAIADDLSNRDSKGQPSKQNKFDVIDLDPYGTAAPFFDAAVQSVRDDGGLLAITCTDSALWAGHCYPEKSYALYGGIPVKGLHSHEAGLRMIIHAVAASAARYGLHVEPQVSLSIDYYTKVFLKVSKSPAAVKFHGAKTMLVFTCDAGCGAWETQPLLRAKVVDNKKGSFKIHKHTFAQGPTADRLCQHCGTKMHLSGPMYAGALHKRDFVEDLLAQVPKEDVAVYETLPRLEGMLNNVLEEFFVPPEEEGSIPKPPDAIHAVIDQFPFYFMPSRVAATLSCSTPPEDQIRGALVHLGYNVGTSHCRAGSIKTNAPWETIWWVFVEWIRQQAPIKTEKIKQTMPGWKILNDRGFFEDEAKKTTEEQKPATEEDITMEDTAKEAGEVGKDGNGETKPLTVEELKKTLVFGPELGVLGKKSKPQGVVRYQSNPRANWGPLARASAR